MCITVLDSIREVVLINIKISRIADYIIAEAILGVDFLEVNKCVLKFTTIHNNNMVALQLFL